MSARGNLPAFPENTHIFSAGLPLRHSRHSLPHGRKKMHAYLAGAALPAPRRKNQKTDFAALPPEGYPAADYRSRDTS